MDPVRTYDYLTRSRDRIFGSVRALSPEQRHRQFSFGPGTIAATLTHTMVAEWYYLQRLSGAEVPPYDEWPIRDEAPPEFEILESTWRTQAVLVRKALESERDWSRPIHYRSFPNDQGRRFDITASAADLVTQLLLHEVHHRAQVMAMIRLLAAEGSAAPVQDIDFGALMFDRRPLA